MKEKELIDGFEDFADQSQNNEEKIDAIKYGNKLNFSSSRDANATTKVNTEGNDFNEDGWDDEENHEREEDDQMDIEENSYENENQEGNRIDQFFEINSNNLKLQVRDEDKKSQEKFHQNQAHHEAGRNISLNRTEYQKMVVEETTLHQDNQKSYINLNKINSFPKEEIEKNQENQKREDIVDNCSNTENHQDMLIDGQNSEKTLNKESSDSKQICSESLEETQKKLVKYNYEECFRLLGTFSIINAIIASNEINQEKIRAKNGSIKLNSTMINSLLDKVNIVSFKDKTFFDFLENELKIPKKIIDNLLKEEQNNNNEKVKQLNILYSLKLTKILLMYLDFTPNACLEFNNSKFHFKHYQTFKEQFKEFNQGIILSIKQEIIKDLNLDNSLLNNGKFTIPNIKIDQSPFKKELINFNDKMRETLTNMVKTISGKRKNKNRRSTDDKKINDIIQPKNLLIILLQMNAKNIMITLCIN